MTDEDIIQAAADVYIDLGGGGGRWVGRALAAAVVAAVRPLIEVQVLTEAMDEIDALAGETAAAETNQAVDAVLAHLRRFAADRGVGGQHTDTPAAGNGPSPQAAETPNNPNTCGDCGHDHTGPAGICIGCPCENYPGSESTVIHDLRGNAGTPEATE